VIAAQAKLIAIVAGLIVLLAAGWTLHAGKLRAERDAALREAGANAEAVREARAANAAWEQATLDTHAALAQCQAQWAEATESAARAQALAEQGRREAARVRADFAARFAARGATCEAALAELDTACAAVGGY
jgi:hypothetical protein